MDPQEPKHALSSTRTEPHSALQGRPTCGPCGGSPPSCLTPRRGCAPCLSSYVRGAAARGVVGGSPGWAFHNCGFTVRPRCAGYGLLGCQRRGAVGARSTLLLPLQCRVRFRRRKRTLGGLGLHTRVVGGRPLVMGTPDGCSRGRYVSLLTRRIHRQPNRKWTTPMPQQVTGHAIVQLVGGTPEAANAVLDALAAAFPTSVEHGPLRVSDWRPAHEWTGPKIEQPYMWSQTFSTQTLRPAEGLSPLSGSITADVRGDTAAGSPRSSAACSTWRNRERFSTVTSGKSGFT